ncbi:MAG: hypothetical protein JWL62_936, partial [Hyphomicrobiales bacterium]|nr:hypothetical protein [Hyphomicrobiales bacterium]
NNSNPVQSNQNANIRNNAGPTTGDSNLRPSTGTAGGPGISGSAGEVGRGVNSQQCGDVLAHRQNFTANVVAECERGGASGRSTSDPAAATQRSLEPMDNRALNSICRGC